MRTTLIAFFGEREEREEEEIEEREFGGERKRPTLDILAGRCKCIDDAGEGDTAGGGTAERIAGRSSVCIV